MRKTVVVHRGARDHYEVAQALAEREALAGLFTDLYWPAGSKWAALLGKVAGARVERQLRQRCHPGLPAGKVRTRAFSGLLSFGLDKLPSAPFALRRRATRWTDRVLGAAAGRFATAHDAALLAYSYYAHSAFSHAAASVPRILFQLHPHPVSVREILRRELSDAPDCAVSLGKEWELALPEDDFARLVAETEMADCWIVASSFSRRTLVENGTDAARIHVVPYGVDLERFRPLPGRKELTPERPLRLLFVGTINQRKGIRYLLEALRLLPGRAVELVVCGRVVDDLSLFRGLEANVQVRPSVSHAELLAAYQAADLFVFPSLAEGFGHVLLEAMASGLPVLSTPNTAAPDLITNGREGFIVEPRRVDQLRDRIEWSIEHRAELRHMGEMARRQAETFTWARFRERIAGVVDGHLAGRATEREGAVAHV